MSRPYRMPAWKTAPFIRLLIPFIAGILLQWYLPIPYHMIITAMTCFSLASLLFIFFPLALRFRWRALQGWLLHLLLVSLGSFVTWQNDIRHDPGWFGNSLRAGDYMVVRVDEPLTEKTKTFKTTGIVESLVRHDSVIPCMGKVLLYLSRDSESAALHYGDRLLVNARIQSIRNSGNPGAFDYEQYAAFQQVFHQVFLKGGDWLLLPGRNANPFRQFVYTARTTVLASLRKTMPPEKDELGLAEALLIGYTNDLDKDLVQAYTNTGVVHIIAISGMHLALIYMMLVWLFDRIPGLRQIKLLQLILILGCLWLFSFMTGGGASILRAAVMFSFISTGKYLSRRSSIYNSLASSAFVLLLYNPYFLWDVGFQLSYLAIVGIILFQRPFYALLQVKNRLLDELWKLASVSLAAQVLTLPICIYYFHQVPVLFLLANIIAVPVSGIILYAEIILLILSPVPVLGHYAGKITSRMLDIMNGAIRWIDQFTFSVWDRIPASLLSTVLLYAIIITLTAWLFKKERKWFHFALSLILVFVLNNTIFQWKVAQQQKLIVYNIPRMQAIDIVNGNAFQFAGDPRLSGEVQLSHFHLYPSRVALGIHETTEPLSGLFQQGIFYRFCNRNMAFINKPLVFEPVQNKINIDYVVISHNPSVSIKELAEVFHCRQYIFDASNSLWKIAKWQADCSALHLQGYSVPEQGGLVFDLDEQ